jgi:hypothetical protein
MDLKGIVLECGTDSFAGFEGIVRIMWIVVFWKD